MPKTCFRVTTVVNKVVRVVTWTEPGPTFENSGRSLRAPGSTISKYEMISGSLMKTAFPIQAKMKSVVSLKEPIY